MTPAPSKSPEKSPEPESTWADWAKTIGLSVLIALGARTFLGEPRYIPTPSMVPTLLVDDRLLVDKITYRFSSPQRGDIIVFNPPPALAQQNMKDALIKRIIGMPGDQVEAKDGKVWINHQLIQEPYIKQEPPSIPAPPTNVVVPEGQYFVMGDNRNNSNDSRFWGFVPQANIIGRATVRFWPPNRIGGINFYK